MRKKNYIRKIIKLIRHPVEVFRNRIKKVLKQQLLELEKEKPTAKKPAAKKTEAKKPAVKKTEAKKPVAKKTIQKDSEVIETVKHIFSTVINEIPVANASLSHYEIALYFAGGMGNIYQVEQWVKTLNVLDKQKKIVLIVRIKEVYEWVQKNTDFVVVYCRTIADLTKVYEENNFKCILYVNHGFKNFQSLIVGDALHVHINHGESDKTSTITNQSKAYDYVFIVGDAAYDKYNLNLIKKNMDNFIQVGRPQLDHIEEIAPFDIEKLRKEISSETDIEELKSQKNTSNRKRNNIVVSEPNNTIKKVILYAPTWEGTHDSMNFTSLNDYGMSLVQQLVNHPDYYLVYKPHPNTGSREASTKTINNAIIKLLNSHKGGEVVLDGDINSLYKHIDLAIFDNSAVAIDYLQVDKPMLMTDMFHRIKDRHSKPTITKAARMLSSTDVYSIPMIVKDEIENDTLSRERNIIRKYFLGDFDYSKKESTEKFVSTILNIVEERDRLVEDLVELNKKAKPILEKETTEQKQSLQGYQRMRA